MKSHHLHFLLFLFLFSSFSLITPSLGVGKCNPNDYKALMNIKQSLNNPSYLASWVPNTDCCRWEVVKCALNTNRVNQLLIFIANISGQIPAAVGDLPYLEILVFRHIKNLTGPIPPTITKLKKLTILRLSSNDLSGPIPNFLNQLPKLDFLELSFNKFSGSIPPNLSTLKHLLAIHLDRNKLTGSIPESFGEFSGSIPNLYLSHNQLSGLVPKTLGNVGFDIIDLSRNQLVGDPSFFFSPNRKTRIIDLSRNQFEFDLTNVKFQKGLTNLDLNHNKIFGRLPEEGLKDLDLQFLNVSYNRLCGKIPIGGKLQSFDITSYFHNKCLCGAPLGSCK